MEEERLQETSKVLVEPLQPSEIEPGFGSDSDVLRVTFPNLRGSLEASESLQIVILRTGVTEVGIWVEPFEEREIVGLEFDEAAGVDETFVIWGETLVVGVGGERGGETFETGGVVGRVFGEGGKFGVLFGDVGDTFVIETEGEVFVVVGEGGVRF